MSRPVVIAEAVLRETPAAPDWRQARRLRIFALDPSLRRSSGQETIVEVPYEPLGPDFQGSRLQMSLHPGPFGVHGGRPLNLDDPLLLMRQGNAPAAGDPQFLQQMTYAVCSWTLRRFAHALGREPEYSFAGPLRIEPYAFEQANACYDRERRALSFGWFACGADACGSRRGTLTFTAAAQDIIIHEMTHALLDGLRPNLLVPTNRDVLAFHEGFADLVAIFARFSQRELVQHCIAESRGDINDEALIAIGRQFGRDLQRKGPLRTSILDPVDYQSEQPAPINYHNTLAPHDRGSLLVSAVFEAFRTVYLRRTRHWRSVCSSVPTLAEHPVLIAALAETATKLAGHFLNIIIRAVDYLPPVDIDLGDVLRAMITADADLVPSDDWHYREALVYAFRRYGIEVDSVLDLSESSLRWQGPDPVWGLDCSALAGLGRLPVASCGPQAAAVRLRRAHIVQCFLQDNRANWQWLGLADPQSQRPAERVAIESIRALQQIAPDGHLQVLYVIEVLAWSWIDELGWFPGGATLIVGPDGGLRYLIHKRLRSRERQQQTHRYLLGAGAAHAELMRTRRGPAWVAAEAAQLLLKLHQRCC